MYKNYKRYTKFKAIDIKSIAFFISEEKRNIISAKLNELRQKNNNRPQDELT